MILRDSNRTLPLSPAIVSDAAATFGTPLYLYDQQLLLQQAAALKDVFRDLAEIRYAMFANSNVELLKLLRDSGIGCLASSPTELALATASGFSPQDTVITGSAFAAEEMQIFGRARSFVNLDSIGQVAVAARAGISSAGVRLNISACIDTAELPFNSCVGGESRVGILEEELPAFFAEAAKQKITVSGLHVYTGTNQLGADLMLRVIERLFEIAARYPSITCINIGGGFGLAYTSTEAAFPWEYFRSELLQRRNAAEQRLGRRLKLMAEPGRALVGPAGWLITSVVDVKERLGGKLLVATDTSLSNFPRPYIYGQRGQHPVSLLPARPRPARETIVTLCGNALASGDRIAEQALLPCTPEPGDFIVLHDAGAYCFSMSSQFSGRLRPAEVLVERGNDGRVSLRCIRSRETIDSVFAAYPVPAPLNELPSRMSFSPESRYVSQ